MSMPGTMSTHLAKLKVWKVFNQPWSALPRSELGRETSFIVEITVEEEDLAKVLWEVRKARVGCSDRKKNSLLALSVGYCRDWFL